MIYLTVEKHLDPYAVLDREGGEVGYWYPEDTVASVRTSGNSSSDSTAANQ